MPIEHSLQRFERVRHEAALNGLDFASVVGNDPITVSMGSSLPASWQVLTVKGQNVVSIPVAVRIIVCLCVGGLIFWLLQLLVVAIPVPDPFKLAANVILLGLTILAGIGISLSVVGGRPLFRS